MSDATQPAIRLPHDFLHGVLKVCTNMGPAKITEDLYDTMKLFSFVCPEDTYKAEDYQNIEHSGIHVANILAYALVHTPQITGWLAKISSEYENTYVAMSTLAYELYELANRMKMRVNE